MTLLRCGKENVESAYVLLFFPTDCNIKKLIILYCLIIFLPLISSFLRILPLLVQHEYVSVEIINCILLPSSAVNTNLLTASLNVSCF